jgi:hypothetical protein
MDKPQVGLQRLAGRRVRITVKRGAVTTEATLTMAEVAELARKLNEYLGHQK